MANIQHREFNLNFYPSRNNNNIPRLFSSLRWGSHANRILTIVTELTIEMMNLVGPVMAS